MNGQAPDERRYERLKWTVLDESPHRHNSGIAYHWAEHAFPTLSIAELDTIVRRVLLELLEEGLIFFYWSSWDDPGDPATAERPSQAEVEADLRRGGAAGPIPRTVWFTSTEAGVSKLAELPEQTSLSYEGRQEWDAFLERHPEFLQKRQAYHWATMRWVHKGGERPRDPALDYDDYPRT